ncbi:MAG TPA: SDR family oxidoreductase [Verrucomicrobiae bacterium]|nr:SDR family oxidoreductase [Verrucomicrobiae bacterium]
MLLKDKIVLVSGIGPGLGVKLGLEAAREGAAGLIITCRTASKLADAEKRIRAVTEQVPILAKTCNINDKAQCEALVAAGVDKFGRIDALINSAFNHGAMDYASTGNLDQWVTGPIQTNLIGTLRITQAVIPQMKKQKGGAIVMINTMAVRQVPPLGEAGYAASKAALRTSAMYLAKELAGDGIRVNTVHIGWMWGFPVQMYVQYQAQSLKVSEDEIKKGIAANIPMGRIPTDDECARPALFLCSDYASAVTGAALDVNGGAYMP